MQETPDHQMHTNEQERDHRANMVSALRLGKHEHSARARIWIANNQQVMRHLESFAVTALMADAKVGIKMLVERVRWYGIVEHKDASGFKINNSHTAEIARELIRRQPLLARVFETRRAGNEWAK